MALGGGSSDEVANGVAVDRGGNIAVIGTFQGTVDFGGGALTSAGLSDMFLVKLSPLGNHIWSKVIGGAGPDADYAVAVDGVGTVAMVGAIQNVVGQSDVFVAKYSAAGAPLWSKSFGGTLNDVGTAVALDGSGNVVVTGYFQGTVDFGSGPLPAASGDAFLLNLGP